MSGKPIILNARLPFTPIKIIGQRKSEEDALELSGWEDDRERIESFMSKKMKAVGLHIVITNNVFPTTYYSSLPKVKGYSVKGYSSANRKQEDLNWEMTFEILQDDKFPSFRAFIEASTDIKIPCTALPEMKAESEKDLWEKKLPRMLLENPEVEVTIKTIDPKTEIVHKEITKKKIFSFNIQECNSWQEVMMKEAIANG